MLGIAAAVTARARGQRRQGRLGQAAVHRTAAGLLLRTFKIIAHIVALIPTHMGAHTHTRVRTHTRNRLVLPHSAGRLAVVRLQPIPPPPQPGP